MCGRYAASKDQAALVEEFEAIATGPELAPDFNVAPTKSVNAVMVRKRSDEDGNPVQRRELAVVRWGLVPSWAKDPSIGSRLVNARAETVAEKPAFRRAFAKRRCLIPADGFYEWYTPQAELLGPGKPVKPVKQPYFIHPADGSLLPMAGLYEFWKDPSRDPEDPSAWLTTVTVITTQASDAVGHIHDRMPLVIGRDQWEAWLDPEFGRSASDVVDLMVPASALGLDIYPVSTSVNSVRNNGPQLLDPIPLDLGVAGPGDQGGLFDV